MADDEQNPIVNDEYINQIVNFGLSAEEAKVYLSLLRRGPRGEVVGRIKEELEIGRTTIYAIMERLTEKGWVSGEEISQNPRRIKYVTYPPYSTFSKKIQEKLRELELMKKSSLFIGDSLDKVYQGAKKLNLDSIHPGAFKYLKLLINQGFKLKSEVIEHSVDSRRRISYDYELKGLKGFPKDCGLIIFEYDEDIEEDKSLIKQALEIFKSKTDYEIRKDKIPGFEDLKLEDTKFDKYSGTTLSIKLKFKKKWWKIGNQVVIPSKNRIFLLFGNEQNFKILMESILLIEQFHHLV